MSIVRPLRERALIYWQVSKTLHQQHSSEYTIQEALELLNDIMLTSNDKSHIYKLAQSLKAEIIEPKSNTKTKTRTQATTTL